MRLENAGFNAYAERPERENKFLVERLAEFGRSGEKEAGPAPAARVGVESELRNGENGACVIEERAIHLALVIIEDAEIYDFLRHRNSGGRRILAPDGDERNEARPYRARDAAIDGNACTGDSLEYDSHVSRRMILHCGARDLVLVSARESCTQMTQSGEYPGRRAGNRFSRL